uniref:HSF_DOMAIN domain-containing protein n=1 Tax=Steinernema glaseri TaxID=37863 RepID=A0A1I7Z465_9BILA
MVSCQGAQLIPSQGRLCSEFQFRELFQQLRTFYGSAFTRKPHSPGYAAVRPYVLRVSAQREQVRLRNLGGWS